MLVDHNQAQLEFLETCSLGDSRKIQVMLATGRVQPDFQHKINGWTALHWAARRGHEDVCLLLLSAGFTRECKDHVGKTPFDVVLPRNRDLREILRPEDREVTPENSPLRESAKKRDAETSDRTGETMPAEAGSTASSRRGSSESGGSPPKFVPNYIKNPPFPFTQKTQSFDMVTGPGSPTKAAGDGYYSYGRRDSLNRTRFLLLRTSCANGKEAFKRITLPGGSNVDQLLRTVEKAMRNSGKCEAVLTLPDKILVEDDEQIRDFADCQKIEAVFNERISSSPEKAGEVRVERRTSIPQPNSLRKQSLKMADDNHVEESSLVSAPSADTSLIEIPVSERVEEEKKTEEHEKTPEQAIEVTVPSPAATTPKAVSEEPAPEPVRVPIVDVPVTDPLPLEEEESLPVIAPQESEEEESEEEPEEQTVVAEQKKASMSVDSENGEHEYVKVTAEEAKEDGHEIVLEKAPTPVEEPPLVEGVLSAPSEPSPPFSVPSPIDTLSPQPAKVVEEKKVTPGKSGCGGLTAFIDSNPELVRTVAIGSAVTATVALGLFVYKKTHQ